jgi:hypothetical protein
MINVSDDGWLMKPSGHVADAVTAGADVCATIDRITDVVFDNL